MDQVVQVFKALGDETRLKILLILSKRTICAKGIAKHLGISEAAVSQHIKILKDVGLIRGEKVGYYVHYNIQENILADVIKFIEHINGANTLDISKWLHMPLNCQVECKARQNKCCHRIK